jgi:hypothetical protein
MQPVGQPSGARCRPKVARRGRCGGSGQSAKGGRSHRIRPPNGCTPEGAREIRIRHPRTPAGVHGSCCRGSGGSRSLRSLHHRLHSISPPGWKASENSLAIHRWVNARMGKESLQGRQNGCCAPHGSSVPHGTLPLPIPLPSAEALGYFQSLPRKHPRIPLARNARPQ